MFKLLSTIVRWMAHLARKRTKKKTNKKKERDCIVQATESRPRVYGPGMGDEGSAPNFSKIWNFPEKQGNSSSGKKIIIIKNNNNTNDCHSQTSGYMAYVKSRCVVWTDDGNLSIMHRSMLSRWGGGGRGAGGAGYWVGIWHFSKICRRIPAHGQIIPVNCYQISPPRAAHCCQISQGWTQEMHNKNISG